MNILYVFIITCLCCLVSFVAGHGGPMTIYFSAKKFKAEWIIYEVEEVEWANFTLTAPIEGWIAFGFKNESGGFDVIMGHKEITDRYLAEEASMLSAVEDTTLGGKDDLIYKEIQYTKDSTIVKFTRLLDTGDKYDYNLFVEGLNIKWAYGSFDNKTVASGSEAFNFFGNEGDEGKQLKAHGILMVTVVMLLMTSGIVLSRYLKLIFAWWFYAHTAIFSVGLFLIVVSSVIIFKIHNYEFKAGWHSVFGLFFIIGMSLQTILGVISHLKFDMKRLAPPVFPDKIHWFLGRSMYLLGIITVLLGLYALPTRHMSLYAFYLWVIVCFFLVLALEKYIGQSHEVTNNKGIMEDDEAFGDDEEAVYTPKKGNSLSRGHVERTYSPVFLFKLLGPAGLSIVVLFIFVAAGIGTTEL